MAEVLSNTGAKVWAESDYDELWLTVFDQLTGQDGKSNIRLIDEAIGNNEMAISSLNKQLNDLSFSVVNNILTVTYDDEN